MSNVAEFNKVMDATEFFRDGKPTANVLTRNEVLDPRSEKHFKYKTAMAEGKLGASAIFELSGSPCIYFKHLADTVPTDRQLTTIRGLAWNHGLAPMLWVVTPAAVRIYNCYSKPRTDNDKEHEQHLIRSVDDIAGICDMNEELLDERAKQYGIEFATTDYKEHLARDDIDISNN